MSHIEKVPSVLQLEMLEETIKASESNLAELEKDREELRKTPLDNRTYSHKGKIGSNTVKIKKLRKTMEGLDMRREQLYNEVYNKTEKY